MQLLSKIFALLWLDIFTRSSNVAAAVADKMKVIVESTHCRKSLEGLSKEEAQIEGGEGQREREREEERETLRCGIKKRKRGSVIKGGMINRRRS